VSDLKAVAIAAIELARDEWTGKTWDSAPDELLASIQKGRPDADVTGGCGWEGDGSYEAQRLRAEWRSLLERVRSCDPDDEGDMDDLEFLAEEMVEAENEHVEARAMDADEEARYAIDAIEDGDAAEALHRINEAACIEREFGDDPAYGPAVKAVKAWADSLDVAEEAES
jgi:hypothetical protein